MSKKSKDRLAFNFLKSYYEVFKKLTDDKSKAEFVQAICERQFNGVETDLEGMADFAYTSQKHSIDASREGWENLQKRTKVVTPSTPPSTPPSITPSTQEKEEEEEKEKVKEELKQKFLSFWNTYDKKIDSKKAWEKFQKLKPEEITKILSTVANYVNSNSDKQFRKNPVTYLNNKCWNDEITIKDKVHPSGVVLGLDVLGSAMGKQDYNQKIMKSLCDKYGYSIEEIGEMHKDALRKKGHTEEGIKELYKMYNY